MERLFIPARFKGIVKVPHKYLEGLPHRTCVTSAVQFIDSIPGICKELKDLGKEPITTQGRHSSLKFQILGCDVPEIPEAEAFLYIGDGLFHPKEIQLKNNKPVFCFNPKTHQFYELGPAEVDRMKKRHRANLARFYSSDKIGVIISRKPGQFRLNQALKLQEKFPEKEFFWFIADTLDFNEMENYTFIQCYVNTSCPRIGRDDLNKMAKPLINLEDLEGFPEF